MTDEDDTGAAQQPGGSTMQPPASPSLTEAQFPYAATHGLQQPPAAPPALERPPARPARRTWWPLLIAATLFTLVVLTVDLTLGPRPRLGPRSDAAASQAVHGYLTALAEGDATAALGHALGPPADPSLLTDQMLAEARALAPISGIEVSAPTEPGRVPASYLLGGERVSLVFELTLDGDAWRLNQVAAPIDLSGFLVPVAVNGTEPRGLDPQLFPGHYRITSTAPRYEVVTEALEVLHPFEQPVIQTSLALSEAGRAEVIEAAQAHLADCLSRQDLEPPDCGFALDHPEQTPLDESTVSWSARGPAGFADLEITLDHAGSASAGIDLTVHGDVHGVDGSRWEGDVHLTRLRADLTGTEVRVQFG